MRTGSSSMVLIVLLSSLLTAGCQHLYVGRSWGPEGVAKIRESRELPLREGMTLDVATETGAILIVASESGKPEVTAHITAEGRTEDEAWYAAEQHQLVVKEKRNSVVVCAPGPRRVSFMRDTGPPAPFVDLTISVPPGIRVVANTRRGRIVINGPVGDIHARAAEGDLEITDVRGNVVAATNRGSIRLERMQGSRVDLRTLRGPLVMRDVEASTVVASTRVGPVHLRGVTGERLKIVSQDGDIALTDTTGRLEAHTASGSVRLSESTSGSWALASSHGSVFVDHVDGRLAAKCPRGRVEVKEFHGDLSAASGADDIEAHGEFRSLAVASRSGDIRVHIDPGSNVGVPWKIKSEQGDLTLRVPDGFRCLLDAYTATGTVRTDLEVEGSPTTPRLLKGAVAGGGGLVWLRTAGGDVDVFSVVPPDELVR